MRKALAILVLIAVPAPAYWHTANLCHAIVRAETAVVRTAAKAGRGIKSGASAVWKHVK
jgi:hypothetical protein